MGRLTFLLLLVAPTVLISQAGRFQTSYTMKISKDGKDYYERITVDTRKGTETSHVREASSGRVAGDTIYDLHRNLTMIRIPEAKSCFLSNSIENTPRPAELMQLLKLVSSYASVEVNPQKKTTYKVVGKLTDRSGLSQEMADMCADRPIHTIVREAPDQSDAADHMNDADPSLAKKRRGLGETICNLVCYIVCYDVFGPLGQVLQVCDCDYYCS